MQLNKLQSIALITLLVFSFGILTNVSAATPIEKIIDGASKSGEAAGFPLDDKKPKQDFVEAWGTYATGFAGIMSALFLLLVIYAGFMWMTAKGDDTKVATAKSIILGAIVGLVIIIAGRIIVELALAIIGQTICSPTCPQP